MSPTDGVVREQLVVPTLQGLVYQRLRESIASGGLPSGPTTVRELADRFGVSTTPVREALRRLEGDGLVTFTHRSVVINKLSADDLSELHRIRAALEPLAVQSAHSKLTATDFEELDRIVDRLQELENDKPAWSSLHQQFHRTIYALSRSPNVQRFLDGLWSAIEPYRVLFKDRLLAVGEADRQHREIVRALRLPDPSIAMRLAAEHVSLSQQAIAGALRTVQEIAKPEALRRQTTGIDSEVEEPTKVGRTVV